MYLLIFFFKGQESANDGDDNTINESQDDDERALALATDPDLTDLDENEWETLEWLTPEGKLHFFTMYYKLFNFLFLTFPYE